MNPELFFLGLFFGLCFLSGSIPFGLIYSLYIEKDDLREKGSGNIGATNVLRNFGWPPGLLILMLDALKGGLPVILGMNYFGESSIWIAGGILAILGHVYSPFLSFDGGKGVATSAGVFSVLLPVPLMIALGGFGIVVGLTRYMSAGSLTGALLLPLIGGYFKGFGDPVILGAWLLAIVVIWRHRENIQRIIKGEEKTAF